MIRSEETERPAVPGIGIDLEWQAFAQAARMLSEARENPQNRRLVVEALRFNNHLWIELQASLAEPNDHLSREVMSNFLSLSLFVERRTDEAIASTDPSLLDALIDIDRNIAHGQMAGG